MSAIVQSLSSLKKLLIGLCCVVLLCLPVAAQEIDQLKQQQQQLDQQRSQIQKEREKVQRQERSAQKDLNGIRRNIQATTTQIQTTEAKLSNANRVLKKLEAQLGEAEKSYQQRQSATVSRLRFLQRQQSSSGWAVLLQSENLNDFLDRRFRLKQIYKNDRRNLAELKTEAETVDRQRQQVEQQKINTTLLAQQLMGQKAQFEQQAESQKEIVDRLRTNRRALEAAEAQLEKDSKSIGELIQRRIAEERAKNGIVILGTGQFNLPSDGPITSGFGYRTHPILGYQRFHAGVDFGADYGAPILAADRGTVIFAGWYGGYGNTVILDHGNGITTMYAHAQELSVSEGETVERGKAIAATGSTGLSTGPHLHFEVRENGEPVDPMNYL
ncbi:murein hydrolase activator EnvC family protein [Leptolyngbya sp. NIES-2104]|uniref:murein hydrolase activator EnvC family protein n=1 Tax=Leptolyngbya sp. NIES-2104 TaxID=1552121 RepID=UPI0006EC91AF|nr:M23 family metallopeptidase [Leptolyngbya sp. NIES-2104]GAP97520.1 membrane protein related to metalloendopeptidase [Leptolyngbya sp. NIES-2104]